MLDFPESISIFNNNDNPKPQNKQGGKLWHIRVKIVEQSPMNPDTCAIPAEMNPSAVSVARPMSMLNMSVKINLRQ
jgi:hypothetical protein